MNKSLEKRLLYSFMAIMVLVLLGVSLGLSYIINDYFWGTRRRELINDSRKVSQVIANMSNDSSNSSIAQYLRSVDQFLRARLWYIDKNKNIVATSLPIHHGMMHNYNTSNTHRQERNISKRPSHMRMVPARRGVSFNIDDPEIIRLLDGAFAGKIETEKMFNPYLEDYVIAIGIPVKDSENNILGALIINAPIKNNETFMRNIYYYIIGIGLFAILLTLIFVKMLSSHIVKPLLSMKESAAAMAQGDYSLRVDVKGEDEVADLGRSLNSLAGDLSKFIDKTERMEQLRRDFVANVSHELRTPITIIRGYNEAMLDGTITDVETIERYRKLIRIETVRLEGLIRELLDISRLQSRVESHKEKIPLDIIIREVFEKLNIKAQERKIKMMLELDENSYIFGQGDRLVQLGVILADNAIKYTKEEGHVFLKVKRIDDRVVLAVSDNGIGIPEEDISNIWERFYKVDKSHSKAIGGTGLGLSIAKEIIDIHEGTVNIISRVDEGTTIEVSFPAIKEN